MRRIASSRRRARCEEEEEEVEVEVVVGDYEDGKQRHNLSIPVCKDFSRGRCTRSIMECRYAHHPPTVAVQGEQVTVCYDSLRDRCARGVSCRYFHPPSHIRVVMQQAVGIEPSPLGMELRAASSGLVLAPSQAAAAAGVVSVSRPSIEVCRDYARGRCKREAQDCRFAHHIPNSGDGENATVCQDFMRGVCQRGACRYFHPPQHLRVRMRDLPPQTSLRLDTTGMDLYLTSVGCDHPAKRVRLEEPLTGRRHTNVLETRYEEDKLPVCRDFLRNKCARSAACRYVHPAPHAQVVDGYVTLCRDSLRGQCRREACRFHHPHLQSDDYGNPEGSFGDDLSASSPQVGED